MAAVHYRCGDKPVSVNGTLTLKGVSKLLLVLCVSDALRKRRCVEALFLKVSAGDTALSGHVMRRHGEQLVPACGVLRRDVFALH
jgi:hypothetical protein